MKLAVLLSRVRVEEKWIFEALDKRAIAYDKIDDRGAHFDLEEPGRWREYDVVLERSLSYTSGLYATRVLNAWGIPTVNMAHVAETCGDKLVTTTALYKAGVPQPKAWMAFTPEAALATIDRVGYPVILKPVVGSWGRLLSKINDRDAAESILEHKETLGSVQHQVFYIQEYISKPGRDIRSFVIGERTVCAIYRSSEHWITNSARGAVSTTCPITPEIEEIAIRAKHAVGAVLAGIDLMETDDGYSVIEVNTGAEFKGLMGTTEIDIAAEIIDEVVRVAGRARTNGVAQAV